MAGISFFQLSWFYLLLKLTCALTLSSLYYTVEEHSKVGSLIGDIVGDLNISMSDDLEVGFLKGSSAELQEVLEIKEGRIVISSDVDREAFCYEEINCVIGVDVIIKSKELFNIVQVFVTIDDINDSAPKFNKDVLNVDVLENSPAGIKLPLPRAVDADSPKFGLAGYSIKENVTTFLLEHNIKDGSIHLVIESVFDRETKDNYKITLVAFDKGQPSQTGSVVIHVNVLDTNDNKPYFVNLSKQGEILETLPPVTPVMRVSAYDPDLDDNGKIEYSISGSRRAMADFKINKTSGIIYTSKRLDRENRKDYELTVIASDKGRISLSSETEIKIIVTDMNDNSPQIQIQSTGSGTLQVMENKDPNTFVGHVTISDDDEGKNGLVSCVVFPKLFRLEHVFKDEYRLVTTESLDREEIALHTITIKCHDKGVKPRNTTFIGTVTVLDENDNAPEFSETVQDVILTEDDENTQVITVLSAIDKDIGDNGKFVYSVDDSYRHLVSVDANGRVQSEVPLDHEQYQTINIKVFAEDKGNPIKRSSCVINIQILDINDERPQFLSDNYNFEIFENQLGGSTVGQVIAKDADSIPYNEYDMILDEPNRKYFDVDPYGVIRTREKLDREEKSAYIVIVRALDVKDPSLLSTTTVEIKIADENDNTPIITFPSLKNKTMEISKPVEYMEAVGKIEAFDKDAELNGELKYFIYGDEAEYFSINEETGVLVLTEGDDVGYSSGQYTFDVIVSDRGTPARSSSASLTVLFNITEDQTASRRRYGKLGSNALAAIIIGTISTVFIIFLVGAIICFRHQNIKRYEKKHTNTGVNVTNNTDTGKHHVGIRTEASSVTVTSETGLMTESPSLVAYPLQVYIDSTKGPSNPDKRPENDKGQGSKEDVGSEVSIHIILSKQTSSPCINK